MKVLVTGANGFLGACTVRRLIERTSHEVVALIRPGSDDRRLAPLLEETPERVTRFEGTLSNPEDCSAMLADVEIVYHIAATLTGAAVELFSNGSVATRNLLDAMLKQPQCPLFVYCSSFGVYQTAELARGAVLSEKTDLETRPEKRDLYSYSKLHQEQLVMRYRDEYQVAVVCLRPGVIYGPGGGAISGRVGLDLFGIFFLVGDNARLPLTHVQNCADAFIDAGDEAHEGKSFNVVDDDLITTHAFFKRYRRQVRRRFYVPMPYPIIHLVSRVVRWYSRWSKGQLPDIFTPYKTASIWRDRSYPNDALKTTGWRPEISIDDGLAEHFQYLKQQEP